MKRFIMSLLLTVILLLSCPISGATEGTRVHLGPDGTFSVTVPEMAPDFLLWQAQLMSVKDYSNGRKVGLFEAGCPDGAIWALILVLLENERLYILQVQVSYLLPEYFETPDVKFIRTEYYEDAGFMQTNVPTNVLIRVEKEVPWEIVEGYLVRAVI